VSLNNKKKNTKMKTKTRMMGELKQTLNTMEKKLKMRCEKGVALNDQGELTHIAGKEIEYGFVSDMILPPLCDLVDNLVQKLITGKDTGVALNERHSIFLERIIWEEIGRVGTQYANEPDLGLI
jgi:hypothetical protein